MSSYLAASASDGSRAYPMYVLCLFFPSQSSSVPSAGGDLESLQNIVLHVLFLKKKKEARKPRKSLQKQTEYKG